MCTLYFKGLFNFNTHLINKYTLTISQNKGCEQSEKDKVMHPVKHSESGTELFFYPAVSELLCRQCGEINSFLPVFFMSCTAIKRYL